MASGAAEPFDFGAPAGLFTQSRHGRRTASKYKRFATAAEAIRFAMEEIPASLLPTITIEVGDETLDHNRLTRLYEDPNFPGGAGKRASEAGG